MNQQECAERIRLMDEYSQRITDYGVQLEVLKAPAAERNAADWRSAETALAASQNAWEALERHTNEHQCLTLDREPQGAQVSTDGSSQLLGAAAAAALDVILVADDERRFVDVNEAAAALLGLPRREIVGRRIDEFFSEARGDAIPPAWDLFLAEGEQCGICELITGGTQLRRFEYRAKANFAAGLHLSILRERSESGSTRSGAILLEKNKAVFD